MSPSIVTMASAKRGKIPTIACINRATVDFGVDFGDLIRALQEYVDRYLAPVWATPAKLVKKSSPQKHAWTLLFLDSGTAKDVKELGIRADPRTVLGRHKLQCHGLPLAMVFVKATFDAGPDVSARDKIGMAASHELAEMLVDPGNNLWCEYPDGGFCAYEVCDAVEEEYFRVRGIAMSDFVYPAYFERSQVSRSVRLDYMNKVKRPFQILKHGYLPVNNGGKLELKFGSSVKESTFRAENRHFHRIGFRSSQ
jgi:hypothetical protein